MIANKLDDPKSCYQLIKAIDKILGGKRRKTFRWLSDSGAASAQGGKAGKLPKISENVIQKYMARFSSKDKFNYIMWLNSSTFVETCS